jgi:hypothetical protein
MEMLLSVALMLLLPVIHLGGPSLLVFLDKTAALLVPRHKPLRETGLFLASRHLPRQKKHRPQLQLDPGY